MVPDCQVPLVRLLSDVGTGCWPARFQDMSFLKDSRLNRTRRASHLWLATIAVLVLFVLMAIAGFQYR